MLRPWRRLPPLRVRLSGRRRRGFRGSSSSIGLLRSLLFLLFAGGRLDNADLGQAQHAASGGPTLFGLKLGDAFVALQHIAGSGQASLAPQAFVNRHVRISQSMDGRRPRGNARQWRSVLAHEKALFRSCEPEQCKRLFEGLSTERIGRPDRPATPAAADPLFNGMPPGYLNTGKLQANRPDLRIGTRVRHDRMTAFEDGC